MENTRYYAACLKNAVNFLLAWIYTINLSGKGGVFMCICIRGLHIADGVSICNLDT